MELIAHVSPQQNAIQMINIHKVLVVSLLWVGCSKTVRPQVRRGSIMPVASGEAPQKMDGNMKVNAAPAVKGSANPANSLSAVISLLFFAKLAINLLTLQGYNVKSEIYYKTHSI